MSGSWHFPSALFFKKMLTIVSRKPRSAATTGFVYKVRTPHGNYTEMDEHDLISDSHGLEAIETFEQKYVITPPKRQKVNNVEPLTIDSGPGLQERVCVKFNGRWKAGKVVDTVDGSKFEDNHPRFTIQYDDGWNIKDRLTLPWYVQRSRSGSRQSSTHQPGVRRRDTMVSTATQTTEQSTFMDLEENKEACFSLQPAPQQGP